MNKSYAADKFAKKAEQPGISARLKSALLTQAQMLQALANNTRSTSTFRGK